LQNLSTLAVKTIEIIFDTTPIMTTLESTIKTMSTLVGFDTVSHNSNRALIDWAANKIEAAGGIVMVQDGDEPGKANLFATLGSQDKRGLMLSGHSDVVPVAGQAWTCDPFTLTERDGRLLGRGSADMKGFIACVLESLPLFSPDKLKTPIHIALSYNEETNMHGMKLLAKHFELAPIKPLACIVGEPTLMRIVVANKGAAIYKVNLTGFEVHSSLRDQGVSAVEMAAELIVFINKLQVKLKSAGSHDGFDFPYSSVHCGKIQGGTAHNITAKDCEFIFEVRALPGVKTSLIVDQVRAYAELLTKQMRQISAQCQIVIAEIVDAPSLDEKGNVYLAQAMMPMCKVDGVGRVSFGTEAGILQDAGVPTVVCGPGEIRVAHQADEYVEISQLAKCLDFMKALGAQAGSKEGLSLSA
jgi:acetylornithine deacetylase